jgi:hypothetical protein
MPHCSTLRAMFLLIITEWSMPFFLGFFLLDPLATLHATAFMHHGDQTR